MSDIDREDYLKTLIYLGYVYLKEWQLIKILSDICQCLTKEQLLNIHPFASKQSLFAWYCGYLIDQYSSEYSLCDDGDLKFIENEAGRIGMRIQRDDNGVSIVDPLSIHANPA